MKSEPEKGRTEGIRKKSNNPRFKNLFLKISSPPTQPPLELDIFFILFRCSFLLQERTEI